ncbi:hypothetical protein Ahy_B05g076850 [Arachis hypogaea]|uniref:F-box associated beta-propeller type 1 domain-containing protein n=1 Tax=Arachis hypogaea TaxID=3818 RepID=A0A444Z4H7_ARAHY|nr:hypothetical protein Ahy_B05g076850 [Arachis hypogaea]
MRKEQQEQFDWGEMQSALDKIVEQNKWQQRNLTEFKNLYDARTISRRSVIIGIGYPPSDQNSLWFVRAFVDDGHQVQFNVPTENQQFSFYAVIGSDHGNICLRISMGGLNSRLLIWNPLTGKKRYASDESIKHLAHVVSIYAFGFLEDTIEYRILHALKKNFSQRMLSWCLYTSFEKDWTHSGTFETNMQKIGPKYVVKDGIFYWIGWEGANRIEASSIITFNLIQEMFHEAMIPMKVKSDYHALTQFNDGVSFVTYRNVGFTRQVMVWQLRKNWDHDLEWEKMLRVSRFGIPYTPILFVDKDIISFMEARSGYKGFNDTEGDERSCSFNNKRKVYELCSNEWLSFTNKTGCSSLANEITQQKNASDIPVLGLVPPIHRIAEEQPSIILDNSFTIGFRTTNVAETIDINEKPSIQTTEDTPFLGSNVLSQVTLSRDDSKHARIERATKIAKKRKCVGIASQQAMVNTLGVIQTTFNVEDKENLMDYVVDGCIIDQGQCDGRSENQIKKNVSIPISSVSQWPLSPPSKGAAQHVRIERAFILAKRKQTTVSRTQEGTKSANTFTTQTMEVTSMEGNKASYRSNTHIKSTERGEHHTEIHEDIVRELKQMLDDNNVLVKAFRMVRDTLAREFNNTIKLRLLGKRGKDGRRYNLPNTDEVAALIVDLFISEDELKELTLIEIERTLNPYNKSLQDFSPMPVPDISQLNSQLYADGMNRLKYMT